MDPNNQNPQVDQAGLSKLESDLKSLENNIPQTSGQVAPIPTSIPTTNNASTNSDSPTVNSVNPTSPPPLQAPPPPPVSVSTVSEEPPKKSNLVIMVAIILVILAIVAVFIYTVAQKFSVKKEGTPVPVVVSTSTPIALVEESPISTSSGAPSSAPLEITDKVIDIKSNAYQPNSITVKAGETVMVTNSDTVGHSVTENTGIFDTGLLAAGETKTFVAPNKVGTYTFHCSAHSSMTGLLIVQ